MAPNYFFPPLRLLTSKKLIIKFAFSHFHSNLNKTIKILLFFNTSAPSFKGTAPSFSFLLSFKGTGLFFFGFWFFSYKDNLI